MTSITLTRVADGFRHTLTLFTGRTLRVVDGGLMTWSDSRLKSSSTQVRVTLNELAEMIEAEGWAFDKVAMSGFVRASEAGQEHDPFEGIGGAA
ncbi:MAG TPA: hypothetical protein PK095_00095 [Myxococcota bacterium]|nr:hypothetical protein [Myxococcota bacterium]